MFSRSKTITMLTVAASLLAAGSAFAVKTIAPARPALASGAMCPGGASASTPMLAFDERWNGLWRPLSRELTRLSWVNCSSGWEFGTFFGAAPGDLARAEGLDLSTLPMMR